MIRIILVALTVVLFLIFSIPMLVVLGIQEKGTRGRFRPKACTRCRGCSALY